MKLYPATREAAFARLAQFEKKASRYSSQRNYVMEGHENVSRLSAAVRYRLISEKEVTEGITQRYAFSTVQKFVQEVYWRRYWKSWLRMRPHVWDEYTEWLVDSPEPSGLMKRVMGGEGEVAIMNAFVKELISTGYMHNHARMWFAAYWVHTLKFPWQQGADFFYRHLLDADPASNTLSWRWVAGLHTAGKTYLARRSNPGKTYLARRSNLEKYLSPELLERHSAGLEQLEGGVALRLEEEVKPKAVRPDLSEEEVDQNQMTGFWVHEDDLSAETFIKVAYSQVILTNPEGPKAEAAKQEWLEEAYVDTVKRLSVQVHRCDLSVDKMVRWAQTSGLTQIVSMRPEIGYLNDSLAELKRGLERAGILLILLDRPEDLTVLPHAQSGFFSFWKKIERQVRSFKAS